MQYVDLEPRISRGMRDLLEPLTVGGAIPDSEALRQICAELEFFLPPTLGVVYPYWKDRNGESLDGVFVDTAVKTAARQAHINGHVILISDQTTTPFSLHLRVAESADTIEWMVCRLGHRGNGKGNMHRIPWGKARHVSDYEAIDWVYQLGFGDE